MLGEPGLQGVQVQRVAGQPVHRREVALIGQAGVQSPEHLHNAQGGLRHRLRNVAAGRGYRPDDGQSALSLLAAQGDHPASPFIELSQTAAQIGGVALLAGHLLQTAGHLPQGLCPSGGGVRHQRHRIAHIPEVLRDGDARVDRGLPGRHRHVGGVGDEHRALHQGVAGLGVLQLRKLV